jgi:hypothetical protein
MVDNKLFKEIPLKRLKPVDGMAVTAQVWDEAHDYHFQQQRLHDLLLHGSGIVSGLNVVASDPPDSAVNIYPGIAIDANGNMIVVTEPVAFHFGPAQGLLYLVISYEESRPEQQSTGGPLYINAQFGIETVATPPRPPYIELARIQRAKDGQINQAVQADFPAVNEIDLRFRPQKDSSMIEQAPFARVAVCYADKMVHADRGHGWGSLAQQLRRMGRRVNVDDNVTVDAGLQKYDLVVLVAQGAFQVSREEMNLLYAYIHGGGTVLMEGCLREHGDGNSPAQALFFDLANSFGITMGEIGPDHPLMSNANLFAVSPVGFETNDHAGLWVGDGLIISGKDYGCLWLGSRRDRPASREEIRAALEWGENLVDFAQKRRWQVLSS